MDIFFNCGCREWRIADFDEKGIKEQPPNTVINHECAKIKVFREEKGLKRYFLKV